MRRIRVGLAQVNPTVGAVEANARLVIAGMERARALRAPTSSRSRSWS